MSAAERATPPECANCGAAIPPDARACPACGADERTGWREQSLYDDLDLPESAFEDDGASLKPRRPPARDVNGIAWYWWCVGVAVVFLVGLRFLGLL